MKNVKYIVVLNKNIFILIVWKPFKFFVSEPKTKYKNYKIQLNNNFFNYTKNQYNKNN